MRKEIPTPPTVESQLTKVKESIFSPSKKPAHKVVVIKKDPIKIDDDPVRFPTIEDLPKIKKTKKHVGIFVAEGVTGVVLVVFGFVNSGSLYQIAARYEGELATVMYTYPFGTLFMIVGSVVVYDSIKRFGK